MQKYFLSISILFLHTCSFAQYSSEFLQIIQSGNCTTLIDSVKNNFINSKKGDYYQSKFTPAEKTTKQIYFPCIKGIKKDDIKILFGKPHWEKENIWIYYTFPSNKTGFADSYLTIQFNTYGRVENISETNSKNAMNFYDSRIPDSCRIKYLKKHWKQHWQYIDSLGYYEMKSSIQQTQLLEKMFYGNDTITMKRKLGEPSQRINQEKWEYHNSNYYRDGKYIGEGIEIFLYKGKVEKIQWLYSVPLIQNN